MAKNKKDENKSIYEDVERLIETLKSEPNMLSTRIAGATIYSQLKSEVIEDIKKKDKKAYKIIADYKKGVEKKQKTLVKKSPIYMSNVEFQKKIDKKNKPFDFKTRYLEFTHKFLMAYLYHAIQKIMDDIMERGEHVPERNTVMVDLNKLREPDLYAQAVGEQLEKMVKQYVKKEISQAKKEKLFKLF